MIMMDSMSVLFGMGIPIRGWPCADTPAAGSQAGTVLFCWLSRPYMGKAFEGKPCGRAFLPFIDGLRQCRPQRRSASSRAGEPICHIPVERSQFENTNINIDPKRTTKFTDTSML
jgi:hypothetical protein